MRPSNWSGLSKPNFWKMAVTLLALCAATAISLSAQTLTTLHTFAGYSTDGASPYAGLVQATDGNFYGTTYAGGTSGNCQGGCGTVFKITPAGTLTTLHSFDWYDGASPTGALVQGNDGNFYGTTYGGGAAPRVGTVYSKSPRGGALTTLYSFCAQANCTDGQQPYAGLVRGSDGNFYGTTLEGGANTGCSLGSGTCGTVFRITPGGALTTLYSFCSQHNCTDGGNPYAGLVQTNDGNFYGTTFGRGVNGYGTVFKITPSGALTSLYSFCSQTNCADGEYPQSGLVQGIDGNLYGTTPEGGGGQYHQGGTIFKITSSGTLTTLYNFCSQPNCTDGADSLAALLQSTDGNFYGTTIGGGAYCIQNSGCGTIFKITPSGVLITLHSFDDTDDGKAPFAGLVHATDDNFYGTTAFGANPACTTGLRWRLWHGLPSVRAPAQHDIRNQFAQPFHLGRTGGHHRDGRSGRAACADGHRQLHVQWRRDFWLHGSAAGLFAYSGVHDFNSGGGDGCDRGDLFGRYELLRQQRYAHPDCESRSRSLAVRDAAAVPGGGYTRGQRDLRRSADPGRNGTCLPAGAEWQSVRHSVRCSRILTERDRDSQRPLGLSGPSGRPAKDSRRCRRWNSPVDGRIKKPTPRSFLLAISSGSVSVYVTDTTNVVLDIDGYFIPSSGTRRWRFIQSNPCRVVDTRRSQRSAGRTLLARALRNATSRYYRATVDIPGSAVAYSMNFTVLPKGPRVGYLTVWPAGQSQPGVSTLNVSDGDECG